MNSRFCFAAAAIPLMLAAVSCSPAPPAPPATPNSTTGNVLAPKPTPTSIDRETWDIYTIGGARAGYGRTSIKHTRRSQREIIRIEGLNHLAVKRFGDESVQEIRFVSEETPDGELIEFTSEIRAGPTPVHTTGRVAGERLDMETTFDGKRSSSSIPWRSGYGGFYATELSLVNRPMTPGERRTVEALAIAFYQVATVEMIALNYEPVELLTGTHSLLKIDTTTTFLDGTIIEGTIWADRTGETLKTRTELMNMETWRVPKAVALEETEAVEVDMGVVKLDAPLEGPHEAKRIRYRVRLDGGDPMAAFVPGPTQRIESIDPNTARITVYAIRPGQQNGNRRAADDFPTDADRQPNNFIQSDDPLIVAEARKAAGQETDPWKIAVALEQYVQREVTEKDFTQAFATASDVAKSRQGDCSEHAFFLAALARARDIPARVAFGLVYMPQMQAFGYHAWTELFIDGRWIPLDATLGKGGIGAGHLKLGHSNLKGASAFSSFLPVVQVLGRLKIDVLD